ncbi:hypothetical protein STEG23_032415 [Scotinomys teguina]
MPFKVCEELGLNFDVNYTDSFLGECNGCVLFARKFNMELIGVATGDSRTSELTPVDFFQFLFFQSKALMPPAVATFSVAYR